MKQIPDIDLLIANILSNNATEKEIIIFSEWIQNKNNAEYFENAKQYWHISEIKDINIPVCQSGKKEFLNRIRQDKKRTLIKRVISWTAISAAAMAALTISILNIDSDKITDKISTPEILLSNENSKVAFSDEISVTSTSKGSIIKIVKIEDNSEVVLSNIKEDTILSEEAVINTLTVPKGKRTKIILSDNTQMWVNSDSKVIYPAVFGAKNRTVTVHGNVFFEVAKDKSRPFTVITDNIKTTALGTSFEVNNHDKTNCRISLLEGLVSVENENTRLIIKPNRQIISDGSSLKEESFNPHDYGLWRNNILSFNAETLESIIEELSRWHNVKIINRTKNMGKIMFTGKMDDDTIEAHLGVISKNIKITFTREGDTIVIRD